MAWLERANIGTTISDDHRVITIGNTGFWTVYSEVNLPNTPFVWKLDFRPESNTNANIDESRRQFYRDFFLIGLYQTGEAVTVVRRQTCDSFCF